MRKIKTKEQLKNEKCKRKAYFEDRITPDNSSLTEWIINIRNELFEQAEKIKQIENQIFGDLDNYLETKEYEKIVRKLIKEE